MRRHQYELAVDHRGGAPAFLILETQQAVLGHHQHEFVVGMGPGFIGAVGVEDAVDVAHRQALPVDVGVLTLACLVPAKHRGEGACSLAT